MRTKLSEFELRALAAAYDGKVADLSEGINPADLTGDKLDELRDAVKRRDQIRAALDAQE